MVSGEDEEAAGSLVAGSEGSGGQGALHSLLRLQGNGSSD